jgi:hypothetical protein
MLFFILFLGLWSGEGVKQGRGEGEDHSQGTQLDKNITCATVQGGQTVVYTLCNNQKSIGKSM